MRYYSLSSLYGALAQNCRKTQLEEIGVNWDISWVICFTHDFDARTRDLKQG